MNRYHTGKYYLGFSYGLLSLTCTIQAAVVIWDDTASNVNYHNPGQVINAGGVDKFVDSFTFNNVDDPSSLIVNGVTFNPYTGLSGNTASFTNSGITVYMGTGTKNPGTINNNALSINNYALTVSRAGQISTTTDAYIRYTGLEIGARYLIQLWMAPWNNPWPAEFSSSGDFSSGISPEMKSTGTVVDGTHWPQYINGTFHGGWNGTSRLLPITDQYVHACSRRPDPANPEARNGRADSTRVRLSFLIALAPRYAQVI